MQYCPTAKRIRKRRRARDRVFQGIDKQLDVELPNGGRNRGVSPENADSVFEADVQTS